MRIGYWATCCLEPSVEAISKEVFCLSRRFGGRFIFSVNPHFHFRLSREPRIIGFNSSCDLLIRPLIRTLERQVDINHVYGEFSPWVFHKSLRRKPVVLTIASEKGEPIPEFLDRCQAVVVQTGGSQKRLLEMGLDAKKVHLIYPGIDLDRFRPATVAPALRQPRVLFATAPRSADEFEGRGVFLLLEAAALLPHVEFRLLFRSWRAGDTAFSAIQREVVERKLNNIVLTQSFEQDMAKVYQDFHLTIIPYRRVDGGKECPNSALEGLACGLPTIVTEVTPFARFVQENGSGMVCPATPQALAGAVEEALKRYEKLRACSRIAAERHFSLESMFNKYEEIYSQIRPPR